MKKTLHQSHKKHPHVKSHKFVRGGKNAFLLPDAKQHSLLYHLPFSEKLFPYVQLARWERPIGWQLLLWPCLWGLMLANLHGAESRQDFLIQNSFYSIIFVFGAIFMRGAGCVWNDIVDREVDARVIRTKQRPLACGRVSVKQALCFIFLQMAISCLLLLCFNPFSIFLALTSLLLVVFYPFAKRFTHWPQLVLGLVFNWGALLGWSAKMASLSLAPFLLYIGAVCWTIGYDTVYAHMDKKDDLALGIGSTALLWGEKTKPLLLLFYGLFCFFVACALYVAKAGVLSWAGLVVVAAHLLWQVVVLKMNNPTQCLRLFKSNTIIGALLFIGLFLDNFARFA